MSEIRDHLINQKQFELEFLLSKQYVLRDVPPILWENNLIKIIIGPRRSGKSHFAVRTMSSYSHFIYVNFDDMKLTQFSDFNDFLNDLDAIYGQTRSYLFDEIQNLPNWEDYVGQLQRRGCNVLITGSNSKLTSTELASHLTGRYSSIILFPFSFKEYLVARKIDPTQTTGPDMIKTLEEFMKGGGYPEPIIQNINRYAYLNDLFDSILLKDIVMRFNLRKPQLLMDFSYYLISNITQELSFQKLANKLKCSADLLQVYFRYLDQVFLFFDIPRFTEKVSQQIIYNKKAYCIDTGFAEVKGFRILGNEDILYCNLVAIHLHLLELCGKIRVFYWRNSSDWEIDFIIQRGITITHLIQVSYLLKTEKTREREYRSLITGSEELRCDNLIILTRSEEQELNHTWQKISKTVKYIPLWKWLLENDLNK